MSTSENNVILENIEVSKEETAENPNTGEIVKEETAEVTEEEKKEINEENNEDSEIIIPDSNPPAEENKEEIKEEIKEESVAAEAEKPVSESQEEKALTAEQISAVINDANASVLNKIEKIGSDIKDINSRISQLRKLADLHQDIENNMNNQINEYKENLYRRIVNPILVEFFDIQEDMNAEANNNANEETAKLFEEYVEMITRVFKHYGVCVEKINVGDKYDSRIHKPVKAVPTSDKSLDMTIAKTRKTLVHSIDGKVVERAVVFVYQYQEEKKEQTESEQTEIKTETPFEAEQSEASKNESPFEGENQN